MSLVCVVFQDLNIGKDRAAFPDHVRRGWSQDAAHIMVRKVDGFLEVWPDASGKECVWAEILSPRHDGAAGTFYPVAREIVERAQALGSVQFTVHASALNAPYGGGAANGPAWAAYNSRFAAKALHAN